MVRVAEVRSGTLSFPRSVLAVLVLAWAGSCRMRGRSRAGRAEEELARRRSGGRTRQGDHHRRPRYLRFDTFGDEAFWGDTLKLHQAIAGEANGASATA